MNYPALILILLGILLLLLTFSRSAWLGLAAFLVILGGKASYFERRKVAVLIPMILVTVICTLYPLHDLVLTRVTNQDVATEQISTVGRFWLDRQALTMIEGSPVIGVGIGSFLLELAKTAVAGAPIEPAHNLFLLLMAELGLIGILLLVGICFLIARQVFQSRSPQATLAGALLAGLAVISLFDHYFLTLAPGRIMLGLVIGLWAGQAAHDA